MNVGLIHMKLGLKGGLETRLYNYMQYFSRRGDEVYIFTSKITGEVELPPNVHIVKLDLSAIPKPIRPLVFAWKLKEAISQYPIDFSLSMARSYSQTAIIAPNTHKGYMNALGKKWPSLIDRMNLYLDKKAYRSTAYIFACSEMIKQELIDLYGIDAAKIEVLYPPVNTAVFNQDSIYSKSELRQKYGLPQDKKILLFVSTGHKRKGLDMLTEVMQGIDKNIVLAIAGTPFQPSADNIISLGFQRKMQELYRAADLTVHPAVYEPFGQIVTESICCGTPVFVGPGVGAKEILTDEVGIAFSHYNPDQWRQAIEMALTKPWPAIPEDFAQQNDLSLEQHMERMLQVVLR